MSTTTTTDLRDRAYALQDLARALDLDHDRYHAVGNLATAVSVLERAGDRAQAEAILPVLDALVTEASLEIAEAPEDPIANLTRSLEWVRTALDGIDGGTLVSLSHRRDGVVLEIQWTDAALAQWDYPAVRWVERYARAARAQEIDLEPWSDTTVLVRRL